MDEHQPPEIRRSLLQRRASRRAVIGGAAAFAAAGTAAAVAGVSLTGDDDTPVGDGSASAGEAETADAKQEATPTAPPAAALADRARDAAHLLRRAGFGGTMAEIEEFAELGREDAAERLLDFEAADNSALDQRLVEAGLDIENASAGELKPVDLMRWWLVRMAYTRRPMEERMAYIWHGLLTTQLSKVGPQRARLVVDQNRLFRSMALPKYDDLVQAVSKDPAMMVYLDTVESTKDHPNENYARELMELFTMGVGNYSEDDVRESARALTGWRLTQPPRPNVDVSKLSDAEREALRRQILSEFHPTFVRDPRTHDSGQKTFLGETGAWDGEDVVRIIMKQPATGRFITTRLFTELANPNPAPETIDRLAGVWDGSGHNVREVVRAILVSDEFYSEASYRARVRSPVEFLVGMVRGLELETDFTGLERTARGMDQVLFEPPNVAGWPGGAAWLSSSTFFARVNTLEQFFGRRQAVPALNGVNGAEGMVDAAAARLVDGNLPPASRQAIAEYADTLKTDVERAAAVAYLVLGSPEYQLI